MWGETGREQDEVLVWKYVCVCVCVRVCVFMIKHPKKEKISVFLSMVDAGNSPLSQ